uniref:Uncharacterized protein n=1 Tax=Zea mays TaxID=4577 RepID=C4J564_MAIZE|nr:unknown [Zea mays]
MPIHTAPGSSDCQYTQPQKQANISHTTLAATFLKGIWRPTPSPEPWLGSGCPVGVALASITKPYERNQERQPLHTVPVLTRIAPSAVCNKMRGTTTATYVTHH